ncbi:SDR family NAD(P)-dependent oxidoreductase [Streptomyces sp. ODS28]|uniref:SDR family NAD(P)-dependent oxidoreductase n=1 Tax=Streptomyces sp. ODS28 TaxID=3136688 RepID=UPI0031E7DA48
MNTLEPFRLDGAKALVTGASRGIGRAVAVALAEAGADLALSARSNEALKSTADLVARAGRRAVLLAADFSEPEAAGTAVDRAGEALGGLDIVVHNAGVLPVRPDGTPDLAPLQDSAQEDWDAVVTVNLNASAALCRRAHAHLRSSPRASLLLMSSASAVMGTPRMEAYAASKAGQLSLARSLAVGWAREGIRVNALCAGWTRTDMTEYAHRTAPLSDWLMAHVPMGRWAEPEEVAHTALFLSSTAAAYLTGQQVLLDGGLSVPDGGLAGIPKPAPPFAAGG